MLDRLMSVMLLILLLTGTTTVALGNGKAKHPELNAEAKMCVLHKLAEKLTELLVSMRNVVALNQDLINACPNAGHYTFKGFTPAVMGTQVGNDFNLRTGINIKQTSLKIRNPKNAPIKWEREAMERFELPDYPKGAAIAELTIADGEEVYRYIKPIYVTKACLQCHGKRETIREDIRKYLETHYPDDVATGYKEGDLRGGIRITIPANKLDVSE
ncbi:MAG: Tll0287-like domain-containing protein [Planctomycetota bacterium]